MDSLGFAVTRGSVNNMISANIKDSFGNSREVTTSNDRAVGLLEGIDLQFSSSPAQIAGEGGIYDGLKIDGNPATPGTPETFQIDYTDIIAGNQSIVVSIAQGNWSLQGIVRNINTQLDAAGIASKGFSASIQDGQIRITFSPTTPGQDSSFAFSNTSVESSLGLLNGNYNGFITGDKDKNDVITGFSNYTDPNYITI